MGFGNPIALATPALSAPQLSDGLQSRRSGPDKPRTGITLFEVVLALAIFVAAFAAISQILESGSRAAVLSQLTSEAATRCERIQNEVVAGTAPLESASRVPFEDDSQWVWSANVVDTGIPYLLQVEIIVEYLRLVDGQPAARSELSRLMRDPQMYYDAALAAEEEL